MVLLEGPSIGVYGRSRVPSVIFNSSAWLHLRGGGKKTERKGRYPGSATVRLAPATRHTIKQVKIPK